MTDPTRAQQLLAAPPADADVLVRAPGRANLIGEYTDVNEGFVLPVALELATVLAGHAGGDVLRLRSLDLPDEGTVEIDLTTGQGPSGGWGRYATAVVQVLREQGRAVRGFDGVLASDVPIGAGLSSAVAGTDVPRLSAVTIAEATVRTVRRRARTSTRSSPMDVRPRTARG